MTRSCVLEVAHSGTEVSFPRKVSAPQCSNKLVSVQLVPGTGTLVSICCADFLR